MFNCAIVYAYISDFKQCIFVNSISPPNSLLDGSENQSLPAVPFREPLRHPVGHALQLPVLQRIFQNARPS